MFLDGFHLFRLHLAPPKVEDACMKALRRDLAVFAACDAPQWVGLAPFCRILEDMELVSDIRSVCVPYFPSKEIKNGLRLVKFKIWEIRAST